MKSNALLLSVFLVLFTSLVYSDANAQRAPTAPSTVPALKFETKKIKLGGKTLTVEIADSPEKRERGLMFRTKLADGDGMLFVFDDERTLSFWMMNTLIPLAIGYFDKNKKLIDVQEMVPAVAGERFPATYPSKGPAMYALETPKGWFARNNVKPGVTFTFLPKP